MTPAQIELVQDSFAQIATKRDTLSEIFYMKLFDLDPALRAKFAHDLGEQRRKLMGVLATAAQLASEPEMLERVLLGVAERHVGLGIERRHFDHVNEALLWALQTVLTERFGDPMRTAWAEVIGHMASVMHRQLEALEAEALVDGNGDEKLRTTSSKSDVSDAAYAGTVPAIYDACLGPYLFAPYADVVATTLVGIGPKRILETAAGTGIVTARLCSEFPNSSIVATDLNADMLDVARVRLENRSVGFAVADAQDLPFAESAFDAVVCQFGLMFLPDRLRALREARRVLAKSGWFVAVVWDRIEANPASQLVEQAAAELCPHDPPRFLSRSPYGTHDCSVLGEECRQAGFGFVTHRTIQLDVAIGEPAMLIRGLCEGSPLGAEIEARRPGSIKDVMRNAEARFAAAGYKAGGRVPLSAHLLVACV